jgi:hypothetical protein
MAMLFKKRNILLISLICVMGMSPVFAAAQIPEQEKIQLSTKFKRFVRSTVQTVGNSGKELLAIMTLVLICWLKFKKMPVAKPVHAHKDQDADEAGPASQARQEKARPSRKSRENNKKNQLMLQKQPKPADQQSQPKVNPAAQQPANGAPKPADPSLNKERDQKHSAHAQADLHPKQPKPEQKPAAVPEVQQQAKPQDLSEFDDFASEFESVKVEPSSVSWMDRVASAWNGLWKSKPQKSQDSWKPGMQPPCMIPPKS